MSTRSTSSGDGRHTGTAGLVSLVERLRWTTALRLVVALLPVLAWVLLPLDRSAPWTSVAVPAVLYSLFLLAGNVLARTRESALALLGTGLILDGVYLGWMFRCLEGLDGPMGYVLVLHAMSITLLASFRTGVKLVLWHSLVLLVVLEADRVGLLGESVLRSSTTDYALQLVVMWGIVLSTALFAAANERELRRRRYDAEVLRRLALALESADSSTATALLLAHLAKGELLARRAAVVVLDTAEHVPAEEQRTGRAAAGTAVRGRGTAVVLGVDGSEHTQRFTTDLPARSLLVRAVVTHTTLLARAPHALHDAWLETLLPRAHNLVVVPFALEGQTAGALVMEHPGSRWGLRWLDAGRPPRVERRLLATAEQATAHVGQALGRIALVTRLRAAASTDGLTGLANRRAFDEALAAELAQAESPAGTFSVVLVDLDHFKVLNDTHGHLAGDDALRAVGRLLQRSLREGATAARYGGEEFVVLLPGTDREDAVAVAERLRRGIATTEDGPVPVTASLGVACFPADGTDALSLLATADAALYAAKQRGRNRVEDSAALHRADPVATAAPVEATAPRRRAASGRKR
ncbi:diguanylate cyclase (GGDEF)-like protein [Kineococcus xinjiangensis]|uniref:Diguanylate cyclase (GGDEF)-like protein n=1 Tax=Kineococcus xinjiangensis TaxID=512762 RepID=A0A2S6IDY6_9ACTN|nr:GGDEF domain-containing protein [Kineococcus xinjiangensis]PPK92406.1 diguanylate cyclase (GGDEF)-like protein [Kineococcus xinjiangensis]